MKKHKKMSTSTQESGTTIVDTKTSKQKDNMAHCERVTYMASTLIILVAFLTPFIVQRVVSFIELGFFLSELEKDLGNFENIDNQFEIADTAAFDVDMLALHYNLHTGYDSKINLVRSINEIIIKTLDIECAVPWMLMMVYSDKYVISKPVLLTNVLTIRVSVDGNQYLKTFYNVRIHRYSSDKTFVQPKIRFSSTRPTRTYSNTITIEHSHGYYTIIDKETAFCVQEMATLFPADSIIF